MLLPYSSTAVGEKLWMCAGARSAGGAGGGPAGVGGVQHHQQGLRLRHEGRHAGRAVHPLRCALKSIHIYALAMNPGARYLSAMALRPARERVSNYKQEQLRACKQQ